MFSKLLRKQEEEDSMRRKDGKIDRRSTEYKEAVDRMAKAREALKKQRSKSAAPAAKLAARSSSSSSSSGAARRADGRLDQRTAEGRAMAEKMAAMRARRGGKKRGFFSWLLGG